MTETLPKQELLKKLLKMTTSSNDGEALIAIRKANDLLRTAAWDWDKLIDGKIRVVEDPFAAMARPKKAEMAAPPPKPEPQWSFRRAPKTPVYYCKNGCGTQVQYSGWQCSACYVAQTTSAVAAAQSKSGSGFPKIDSQRSNAYADWCYCCGIPVPSRDGFIFKPKDFVSNASTGKSSDWAVVCTACNSSRNPTIGSRPAPRRTVQPQWVDINKL